jgi:oligopeptide/dipeptide ABC transporter ATP-binding protein
MAYFVSYSDSALPQMDTVDLNEYLQKHLDADFMDGFVVKAKQALIFSHNNTVKFKQQFIDTVDGLLEQIFTEGNGKSVTMQQVKSLSDFVEKCIDRLSNKKDNNTYAFRVSFAHEIEHYYHAVKNNTKEQKRYNKELANKKGNIQIKPAGLIDLKDIKSNLRGIIERLKANFERDIAYGKTRNFDMATKYMVDYIKNLAQAVVTKVSKEMAKRKAIRLMEEVGISDAERRFEQFPFEFSGGMRQRIVIAIALSSTPQVLVCDEPTTALDVTIQSQILELINDLKVKRGLSIIFITHDLGVVANMADRVAVMYAGKLVEIGNKEDIFYEPKHPYTWALLSSMPDMDTEGKLDAIPGVPPNMIFPPVGDAFATRNKYAMKIDFEKQPPMFRVSDSHYAATWLLHPDAPKVELPDVIKERILRSHLKHGISTQKEQDANQFENFIRNEHGDDTTNASLVDDQLTQEPNLIEDDSLVAIDSLQQTEVKALQKTVDNIQNLEIKEKAPNSNTAKKPITLVKKPSNTKSRSSFFDKKNKKK